ncbi:Non-classical phosphatidylinositol transfer protein (PITP) [Sorochytrium milnesiophthora]
MAPAALGYYGNLSPEQQTALDSLVTALPAALTENSLAADDQLSIWGATLDPTAASGKDLSKPAAVALLKFLRARDFDVDKSKEMLINALKWRKEFKVAGILAEQFPECITSLGDVYGKDKQGCPITYNFYGGMKVDEVFGEDAGPDKFIRWRVQLMERAIQLLDFNSDIETVMQVHDYLGASMMPGPQMKPVTRQIIQIFQDNYPEFLARKFFINVPAMLSTFFSLATALTPQRTKAKFAMIGTSAAKKTLLQYIDLDQLHPRYGGFQSAASLSTGELESTTEAGVDAAVETVRVGARKWERITRPGVKKGDTVRYNLVCESMDVGVADVMVPADASDADVANAVKQLSAPRQEMASGAVEAPSDGTFVLVLDNSYSLLTGKTVYAKVVVDRPAATTTAAATAPES